MPVASLDRHPGNKENQTLRSELDANQAIRNHKNRSKVYAISQPVVQSEVQAKTKREQQNLNTNSKTKLNHKKGGVPAAQEESSTVSRPSNKLHNKSLTPGLTTQLPVLSSATGVLGYW